MKVGCEGCKGLLCGSTKIMELHPSGDEISILTFSVLELALILFASVGFSPLIFHCPLSIFPHFNFHGMAAILLIVIAVIIIALSLMLAMSHLKHLPNGRGKFAIYNVYICIHLHALVVTAPADYCGTILKR